MDAQKPVNTPLRKCSSRRLNRLLAKALGWRVGEHDHPTVRTPFGEVFKPCEDLNQVRKIELGLNAMQQNTYIMILRSYAGQPDQIGTSFRLLTVPPRVCVMALIQTLGSSNGC